MAVSPFEGDPPGSQWPEKHEINGKLVELSRVVYPSGAEYIVYEMRTSDERINGTMELWVTWADVSPLGNVLFGGFWVLTAAEGTWTDDFSGVESANYLEGKPFQLVVLNDVALGHGAYEGLEMEYAAHRACADPNRNSNSTLSVKATIRSVE